MAKTTTRIEMANLTNQMHTATVGDNANTALREQWTRAKALLRPTATSPQGFINWTAGPEHRDRHRVETALLWNVDGLAKRIPEVLHVLLTKKPSVMILTEIKGDEASLARIGPEKDLRATLCSMGYPYVLASTCTLESIGPGNYGTMVIARTKPTSMAFGLGHGTPTRPREPTTEEMEVNKEGRVITVRFADSNVTIVGAYAPCCNAPFQQ